MIIGIEGGLGTGKTLLMVRYLIKDYLKGINIYTNFEIKQIPYKPIDVVEIMKEENLKNVSVGIDEITVFLDCRKSSSKMNRILSYFILQTRKRNVNLYFCTQNFNMCDFRLLEHTDFRIICSHVRDEDNNVIEGVKAYSIIDCRDMSLDVKDIPITKMYVDIAKFYDFYDTDERILPPI